MTSHSTVAAGNGCGHSSGNCLFTQLLFFKCLCFNRPVLVRVFVLTSRTGLRGFLGLTGVASLLQVSAEHREEQGIRGISSAQPLIYTGNTEHGNTAGG